MFQHNNLINLYRFLFEKGKNSLFPFSNRAAAAKAAENKDVNEYGNATAVPKNTPLVLIYLTEH